MPGNRKIIKNSNIGVRLIEKIFFSFLIVVILLSGCTKAEDDLSETSLSERLNNERKEVYALENKYYEHISATHILNAQLLLFEKFAKNTLLNKFLDAREILLIKEYLCRLENEITVHSRSLQMHRINNRKLQAIRENSTALSSRKKISGELEATACGRDGIEKTILKLNLKHTHWKYSNHCDPIYRKAMARDGKQFDQEADLCDVALKMYERR